MLKPAVRRPGIDKACKTQLLYIPQTLEPGVLNDIIDKIPGDADKSVNRIVYYLFGIGIPGQSSKL